MKAPALLHMCGELANGFTRPYSQGADGTDRRVGMAVTPTAPRVSEHMQSGNTHDFDRSIVTFAREFTQELRTCTTQSPASGAELSDTTAIAAFDPAPVMRGNSADG